MAQSKLQRYYKQRQSERFVGTLSNQEMKTEHPEEVLFDQDQALPMILRTNV